MKRSQTEMIGMVLLVLIIFLAFIVFLIISTRSKQESIYKVFLDTQLTSGFVSAILDVNTNCSDQYETITELIIDCATARAIDCNGQTSCEYLRQTLDKMTQILDEMNIRYVFNITKGNLVIYEKSTCDFSKTIETETTYYPIPLPVSQKIEILLMRCYER